MKTGTVTIRLPMDKIERLQKMAKQRECSVTELLREPISIWLDLGAIGGGNNQEVLEALSKLESNVLGAQQSIAELVITTLRTAIGARYMADKAATNTDEVVSYMSANKPLDPKVKVEWQAMRDQECEQIAQQWIAMALGMQQQEPESERFTGD
ncbi:MAG: ribbon-helix-helix domain-containing protein [Candidatus Obscuribacterales bacterium]|nr:ribbon-helix-helix domain-containing protein [Candidatus Obscuribacterales bacterium]